METDGSLPSLQQPAICPYRQWEEPIPNPVIVFL